MSKKLCIRNTIKHNYSSAKKSIEILDCSLRGESFQNISLTKMCRAVVFKRFNVSKA